MHPIKIKNTINLSNQMIGRHQQLASADRPMIAMPVILAEKDWPQWLGEESASEQDLLALLKPCPDEALKIWPVDKMVGNVRNNGPQLILPVRRKEEVPA